MDVYKINSSKFQRNGTKNNYFEMKDPFDLFHYLSSEQCNVQNLCRICLSANSNDIKTSISENKLLSVMLTSFTSIQIIEDEMLPSGICIACEEQVKNCYEFKLKCEKSDCLLRSVLKGKFVTKDEHIDAVVSTENSINNTSVSKDYRNVIKKEKVEQEWIKIEIKDELLCNDDIEYLDVSSDNDTLCIVQREEKIKKDNLNVTITDSSALLKEVVSEKKHNIKKKEKPYTCSLCSKKFLKLKLLKVHLKLHHDSSKNPYSCQHCKESFMSEHDLRLHSALHAKGGWKCNQCHKEFSARQILRRHIQRHMELKRYACDACGKSFTELYALRRHSRVHTGEQLEKKHKCHICDKRYSESGLLATHLARHTGARPCVCATCGKTFPSARLLASHQLVHSDRKPYACRYCDKRFRHESTRNTHHRTHTGEKPYVCSVCGKSFIQNSNLTLHLRTHTGERPYKCDQCDRQFTSGSTLKNHQRTHTGEKPYGCHVCGKRFARMDMTTHMRHHTGERPFECSVCPKKFVSASRLRDHCRIHTGEKPFECSLCSQKFPTKSHLVKHFKTHKEKKKLVKIEMETTEEEQLETNAIEVSVNDKDDKDIGQYEVPVEVTEELVLQDEGEMKTELVVVDDSGSNANYQSGNICLSTNDVNFVNNDGSYSSDVNLVTVNEGEVSISASSAVLDGTTVKLYQLDQSLVQIHSSGGQVTISKITSKMTANF